MNFRSLCPFFNPVQLNCMLLTATRTFRTAPRFFLNSTSNISIRKMSGATSPIAPEVLNRVGPPQYPLYRLALVVLRRLSPRSGD
jgi:hypothetical protein